MSSVFAFHCFWSQQHVKMLCELKIRKKSILSFREGMGVVRVSELVFWSFWTLLGERRGEGDGDITELCISEFWEKQFFNEIKIFFPFLCILHGIDYLSLSTIIWFNMRILRFIRHISAYSAHSLDTYL